MAYCETLWWIPGEFRLVVLLIVLAVVAVSLYFVHKKQETIAYTYTKHYETERRKTNPCFHCPRPRKYVCDGCYVRLRKEYENGDNGSEKHV